jgi:hypothetical protein
LNFAEKRGALDLDTEIAIPFLLGLPIPRRLGFREVSGSILPARTMLAYLEVLFRL